MALEVWVVSVSFPYTTFFFYLISVWCFWFARFIESMEGERDGQPLVQ
jgi:hypothetical protein